MKSKEPTAIPGNPSPENFFSRQFAQVACLTALVSTAWCAETNSISPNVPERPITPAQRAFWAFQPVRKVTPPAVKRYTWAKTPIDLFVLAKFEEQRIEPAPEATRLELIRRVGFDLTGLPPTREETDVFVRDQAKNAYERMVNRH